MKKLFLNLAAIAVAAGAAIQCAGVYAQSSACVGCAATVVPRSPDCPAGLQWTQQSTGVYTCAAPPPPPPPTPPPQGGDGTGGGSTPASQCLATATPQGYTATSGVTGPTGMTPQVAVIAQVVGLTNYSSDSVYSWSASGPTYTSACGQQGSQYVIACLVHPNGQVNGLIPQYTVGSGGSCNH